MALHSRKLLIGLSACLLAGTIAQADTVTGTGAWQSWSTSNLVQGVNPTPGIPYWNNLSGDGSRYNIGWCLAGGGNCSIPSAPGSVPFFGSNTGGSSTDVAFLNGNYAVTATLEAAITNSRSLDVFGWYNLTADGSIGLLHPLFSPSDNTGTAQTFTPSRAYGFYVEQDQGTPGDPFASKYFSSWIVRKTALKGIPIPAILGSISPYSTPKPAPPIALPISSGPSTPEPVLPTAAALVIRLTVLITTTSLCGSTLSIRRNRPLSGCWLAV
jgi:hypothetical protein